MKSLSSRKKNEKGQGLVEYALILVLVAIVVIGGLTILGPAVGNVFSDINNSITGGEMAQSTCEASGGIWYSNMDNTHYCWHAPQ